MYSLGGTYVNGGREDGQFRGSMTVADWASYKPSSPHPVSGEGLSSAAVVKGYVGIISGIPEALAAVVTLSKKTGSNAEQAKILAERTEAWMLQRFTAWQSKQPSMDAYLEGKSIAEWIKVLPNMKAQSKIVTDTLNEWSKTVLKVELVAYKAYGTLGALAFSNRKTEKDQARTGLEQVIAKYGDTDYGRTCKVLRVAMEAPAQ